MKYQPGLLDSFISPITGKLRSSSLLPLEEDYTYVGDENNNAFESPILIDMRLDIIEILTNLSQAQFIVQTAKQGFGHSQALDELQDGVLRHEKGVVMIATDYLSNHLEKGNIWVGNDDNIATPQPTIALENLPNLTSHSLWRGDSNNRPIEVDRLDELNLPPLGLSINPLYLGKGMIWRGTIDSAGRRVAEASNDLSALENSVTILEFITMPTEIAAAIEALHVIVTGEIGTAAAATLAAAVAAIGAAIGLLRLNTISVNGDVSFFGYKLINLADPINPTDGVNLRTLESAIGGIPNTVQLTGDVTGTGHTGTPFPTTLELTLDEIKIAQDTVNLNNHRIKNLSSEVEEKFDAINYEFLSDLIKRKVGVTWRPA